MTLADDRAGITEVICRYGSALDARDSAGVVACFTDDVRLEYFNATVVANGLEQARAFFKFDGGGGLPGLDAIVSTTHLWSVGSIELRGDDASVSTSCIAYLLGTVDGEGVLVTRGLRYLDEVRRSGDGWLISHRRHIPEWEARCPAVIPSSAAPR